MNTICEYLLKQRTPHVDEVTGSIRETVTGMAQILGWDTNTAAEFEPIYREFIDLRENFGNDDGLFALMLLCTDIHNKMGIGTLSSEHKHIIRHSLGYMSSPWRNKVNPYAYSSAFEYEEDTVDGPEKLSGYADGWDFMQKKYLRNDANMDKLDRLYKFIAKTNTSPKVMQDAIDCSFDVDEYEKWH